MAASVVFIVGTIVTALGSLAAVWYMNASLEKVLIELCGSRERAAFWLVFSNVTLTLLPLIFSLQCAPESSGGRSAVVELATQLKWGLAGLLTAVVVLGFVLSRFIPRAAKPPKDAPQQYAA